MFPARADRIASWLSQTAWGSQFVFHTGDRRAANPAWVDGTFILIGLGYRVIRYLRWEKMSWGDGGWNIVIFSVHQSLRK